MTKKVINIISSFLTFYAISSIYRIHNKNWGRCQKFMFSSSFVLFPFLERGCFCLISCFVRVNRGIYMRAGLEKGGCVSL